MYFRKERLRIVIGLTLLLPILVIAGCGSSLDPITQVPQSIAYADTSSKVFSIMNAGDGREYKITNPDVAGALAFLGDGSDIAVVSANGNIRIYNVLTLSNVANIPCGFEINTRQIVSSPDGKYIAVTGLSGTKAMEVSLVDQKNGSITSYSLGEDVYSMAFSPDGRFLAAGGNGGAIKIWDISGGASPVSITTETFRITNIAFSPDSGTIATGNLNEQVKFWNVSDGSSKGPVITGGVSILFYMPDGTAVVTTSTAKNVLTKYNVTSGADSGVVASVSGKSFAVSRNFKAAFICCSDRVLRLINTETGSVSRFIVGTSADQPVAISW